MSRFLWLLALLMHFLQCLFRGLLEEGHFLRRIPSKACKATSARSTLVCANRRAPATTESKKVVKVPPDQWCWVK